jgi:hypothetical protein
MTPTASIIVFGIFMIGLVAWVVIGRQRREAAWQQFAQEIGGQFIQGGLFRNSKVQAHIHQWTLTLDTYSVPSGDSSTTYTRITAPLQNKGGLQFTIFREGLVAKLDKKLGMKDLEIGVPDFDDAFVIQGSDQNKVSALLAGAKIRQLIQEQRSITLALKEDSLRFHTQGVIRDVPRLKSLFELFSEVLNQLQG